MRIRLTFLLLALLLVPGLAYADAHKMDYFLGGSGGDGGSGIGGAHASINWGTKIPWLDVVGPDFSVQFGGHQGKSLTQVAYQGGLHFTLTSMKKPYKDMPVKPFAHFMAGGVYTNDSTGKAFKDGAFSFGFGVEQFFKKDATQTDHFSGVGYRVQYDYIIRSGDRESFSRVSAGIVYRLLKTH